MSLKPKLEAVIYAAEEPVTLAQLAIIFADEVLPESTLEVVPEQIALAGLSAETEAPSETAQEASPAPAEDAGSTPGQEASPAPGEEANSTPAQDAGATPEQAPVLAEAPAAAEAGDEKKAARQRDRRVREVLQRVLDELMADYANSERGMEIREIAGGYRMATKPEYHDAVRGFVKSLKPPMKLSLQALETLAVIAYKQPVTAPEVSEIRGVDSGGVLGSLVGRKLITTAGRKPVIGRPILYKTTKEFLLRFGLKDVNDLPSMEEFEKMAGELTETEADPEGQPQEDAVMSSSDPEPEVEATAEPHPESRPEPEAEAAAEPHPESQPEPEAEAQPEPKAESHPEPQSEPKP